MRFGTRATGDHPQRAPIRRRGARSGQLGARKLLRGDSGSLFKTSRVKERKLESVRVRLGCTRERRRRGGGTLDREGQPPRGVDGLCTEAAEVAEVDDES